MHAIAQRIVWHLTARRRRRAYVDGILSNVHARRMGEL